MKLTLENKSRIEFELRTSIRITNKDYIERRKREQSGIAESFERRSKDWMVHIKGSTTSGFKSHCEEFCPLHPMSS